MDEILEKLRVKTPDKRAVEVPEPITARVSRENMQRKKPVSPPKLYYRSPQVLSHFCLKTPRVRLEEHVCASSVESTAREMLMQKSRSQPLIYSEELIKNDLEELKTLHDHWNTQARGGGHIKVLAYDQVQTLYESITLFKSPTMFKRLLKGIPCNYRLHPNGFTVGHYVCEQGNLVMLEEVQKHMDNLDLQSRAGLTPSMIAASRGNIDCLSFLVKNGCDLYKKDFVYGWTCLHHAVNNNQYETVVYLIKDCKLKTGVKDCYGRDPMDLSKSKGFMMIYRFINEYLKNQSSWFLKY